MNIIPDTGRQFAAVMHLDEEAQRTADYVVMRARAARRLGGTAKAYRISALALERHANSAEERRFGRAVETFRAAAAENWLIADALEVLESGESL